MTKRLSQHKTHPQNVFAEAILLFFTGLALLIRDRGSAVSSTAYDSLLGFLLLVFSAIRLTEMLAGLRDGHVLSRMLVWLMWTIPVVISGWLTHTQRRLDVGILLGISIAALCVATVYLIAGYGAYDVVIPNAAVGASNGVYTWIRTDGGRHFLPLIYYLLLAAVLIFLTIFSMADRTYWLLALVAIGAFVLAAIFVPEAVRDPLGTLGSLTTLVMLGLGIFTVLIVPG